jgi:hypothetical protein
MGVRRLHTPILDSSHAIVEGGRRGYTYLRVNPRRGHITYTSFFGTNKKEKKKHTTTTAQVRGPPAAHSPGDPGCGPSEGDDMA